jgi:hypothetical protein
MGAVFSELSLNERRFTAHLGLCVPSAAASGSMSLSIFGLVGSDLWSWASILDDGQIEIDVSQPKGRKSCYKAWARTPKIVGLLAFDEHISAEIF